MRAFSAVALREIVERRAVLAAALAAACVPFLVPLLPGVPGDQAETARSVTALVLSCALGLGGSLLVGASVVGRELAERRLSFHFSRPVSSFAIWSGKLAGGLALVLLAELIVFLPASVASGDFPGIVDRDSTMAIWAILFLAVPLFLLAWIGSVALRSRSPWLVVDLVFLVSLPAALFAIGRRFLRYGGEPGPEAVGTAVGVVLAAADLKLPVNLVALAPLTENLPSGTAYKPGDIVLFSNAKTAEIDNTDAEGRVILADALDYANEWKPAVIVDYATLTGAALVALGLEAAIVFTERDDLSRDLVRAGERTDERLWRLPLWEDYKENIKSDWADVKNTGGRWGGSINGAMFLKEFVDEKTPWAHLDIAPTANYDHEHAGYAPGATSFGVALTLRWLRDRVEGGGRRKKAGR